jgi:membrane protease YdiL (CAAX protease family)
MWPVVIAFFAAVFGMLFANALLAGVVLAYYVRQRGFNDGIEAVTAWAMSLPGLAASAAVTGSVLVIVSVGGARLGKHAVSERLRVTRGRLSPLLVAAAALCTFSGGFLFSQSFELFGIKEDGVLAVITKSVNEASWPAWSVSLLGLAVVPGIAEELFFRGFVQTRAVAALGQARGIILSAALFGLFHMDLKQGLYAAMVGTFLGWLAIRAGSIRPSMLAHGTSNGLSLVMARLGVGPDSMTTKIISLAVAAIVVVGTIALVGRAPSATPAAKDDSPA